MRLDQASVVLRPRSVAGVCDLAFRFVFSLAPKLYTRAFLLFMLPGIIGAGALRYLLHADWLNIWIGVAIYITLLQGVFTVTASQLMFSRDVRLKQILADFRKRFLPAAAGGFFSRLFIAAMLPLAGVGLLFWVRYAYVYEAVLLENARGSQARGRSAEFVAGQSGTVFFMLLALFAMQAGFIVCFEVLGRGLVEFLFMMPTAFEPLQQTGGSPFALVGLFCSVPFTATTRFLGYIDGRTRHDGWDMQVSFMALQSEAEGASKA